MRTSNGHEHEHERDGRAALWGAAVLTAMAAAAGFSAPARAQAQPQDMQRPHLADHVFLTTNIVPDAFVNTYVRSSLGVARTLNLDYPALVVHGDTLATLSAEQVSAILEFEYQNAVKDWIAVRAKVEVIGRLGTQLASLVEEGVTVASGFDFGWQARLHESRSTMLCGTLDVSNRTYSIIDPRQFAEDVAAGVPNPQLTDDVPVVRSRGGARFAWAVNRPFGITLLTEGSYGETPWRSQSNTWEYSLGASVDFDAGAAWGIPVGAALAYRQTSLPDLSTSSKDIGRSTILRVAYTGERDFIIGVDFMGLFNSEEAQNNRTIVSGGGTLTLLYYF